jgi:hypothetical protein
MIISSNAFKQFAQAERSILRIGFTSSAHGKYEQAFTAFSQFKSANQSRVVYDLSQSFRFKLDFGPRPVPRFLPSNLKKNESFEQMIYEIYPNLGSQSRPDRIDLNDYLLESNDFCKISSIPFDVLVKLNKDTQCSCPVYFLYRVIRKLDKIKNKKFKNWLSDAPKCYQNFYKKNGNSDQINSNLISRMESSCYFNDLIKNCNKHTVPEEITYDFTNIKNVNNIRKNFLVKI